MLSKITTTPNLPQCSVPVYNLFLLNPTTTTPRMGNPLKTSSGVPFQPSSPTMLPRSTVTPVNEHSLLVTGPADASTLATVSAWCQAQGVLPETLTLGQRTLEDVFLQLTGKGLP